MHRLAAGNGQRERVRAQPQVVDGNDLHLGRFAGAVDHAHETLAAVGVGC